MFFVSKCILHFLTLASMQNWIYMCDLIFIYLLCNNMTPPLKRIQPFYAQKGYVATLIVTHVVLSSPSFPFILLGMMVVLCNI